MFTNVAWGVSMAFFKRNWLKYLPIAIGVALIGLTPIFGVAAGSCMGYHGLVMDTLRACPEARKLLGEDIGLGWFGMSCGSAETEGGHGRANWTLPVKGSMEGGSYSFYLEKHGRGWEMRSAELEVGDRVVDVVACSPGAGPKPVSASDECSSADECAVMSVRCFEQGNMLCAEKFSRAACDKGNIPSCGNLAHILLREKDDPEGAAEAARKACRANDDSGCNNLATALRKLGDMDGAYEAIKKSCSLGLDVGCAERALFEVERGDVAAAKRFASRALKKNPSRASALRRLGHAYLFDGDVDSAVSHYARALAAAGKSDEGQDVKEDVDLPELDLIRNELKSLAGKYPDRTSDVEQALSRVKSMATAVEEEP